jgi:hypothetical protein
MKSIYHFLTTRALKDPIRKVLRILAPGAREAMAFASMDEPGFNRTRYSLDRERGLLLT